MFGGSNIKKWIRIIVSLTNLIYESVDVRYDDPKVVIERVAAALGGGDEGPSRLDHSCNSRLEHGFSRLVCLNVQFA